MFALSGETGETGVVDLRRRAEGCMLQGAWCMVHGAGADEKDILRDFSLIKRSIRQLKNGIRVFYRVITLLFQ